MSNNAHSTTSEPRTPTSDPTRPRSGTTAEASDVNDGLLAALTYMGAGTLPRLLSFVLLPLMTSFVSPAEYGELSVAFAISAAVVLGLGFGLDVAVIRNYFQFADDSQRRDRYIGSVWLFLLVVPLAVATALSAAVVPLLADSRVLRPSSAVLALVGGALYVAATTVPYAVLRAARRLRTFLIIGICSAIISSASAVIAVVALRAGVTGWLIAVLCANLATLVLTLVAVPFRRPGKPDWGQVRGSLALGVPLVPHFLSHWCLQLADRLVLATIVSASALGVYSLAGNLAIPSMILMLSLTQGFMPSYARAGGTGEGAGDLAAVIVMQVTAVALITLAGAVLAPSAINLMTPAEYSAAGPLAIWLVAGYGFLGLYGIPMNLASLTLGKTKGVWRMTVAAAIVNVLIVYLGVPAYGLTAAAAASTVAYAVLFVGVSRYAYRRGARVQISVPKVATVIVTCLAAYAFTATFIGSQTVVDAVFRCAIVLATAALLALLSTAARLRLARILIVVWRRVTFESVRG